MNQNLLNYFQMRQNPAQDQASQIANLSSTATPNEVMRGMQASQPAQRVDAPAPYNPFDEGIRKALEASRASLSPTAEQQNRAMRAGMLEFGSALGNMPKERGFFANLGQTGRALAPAIRSIDAIDSVSEAQNLALANQILAYQNQEKEMQRKLEEDAWHREFKEKELEERRQNHLLHNFMRREGSNMSNSHSRSELENLAIGNSNDSFRTKIDPKIWDARAKNNIKIADDIYNSYQKNREILPAIDQLAGLLETSKLTGEGYYPELKRFIAKQTGANEDMLEAENLGQFYLEWLSDNTSGVLSDKDIAYYSKGFAGISKNPDASIKVLSQLKNKLQQQQEINKKRLTSYEEDPGANLHSLNYFDSPSEADDASIMPSDDASIVPSVNTMQASPAERAALLKQKFIAE